jgi:hypothetical protein
MANKNIITSYALTTQVGQTYFAPIALLPEPLNYPLATIYGFLGRVDPWQDDNDPVPPTQDQQYLKQVFKNMFAVKRVSATGISPVLPRSDWTSSIVYDYYQDDIDMFIKDQNGNLIKNFYVRNRYDQVFKCLWNNNGAPSIREPFFQPGTYGTNNVFKGDDGYKWKYMYTISVGTKRTFLDSVWMPIPIASNPEQILYNTAALGEVEVINVLDGGSGYDPANATITIEISGDGYGATANAEVVGGVITDIIVDNRGTMYSYATANVISSIGSGASLSVPVSPPGGHGFDPLYEFGANHVMLTVEFSGDEGGLVPTKSSQSPTAIDYRQVGIIINATTQTGYPYPATDDVYSLTTDLTIAAGLGDYIQDEVVYQGNSIDTATFVGMVVAFNPASNVLKLINTSGIPITDASIKSNTGTTRTVLLINYPDYIPYSGTILYLENRSSISRSDDGSELLKFVFGY